MIAPAERSFGDALSPMGGVRLLAYVVVGMSLFIYGPIVFSDHMVHDDYFFSLLHDDGSCRATRQWVTITGIGRLISAELVRCVMLPAYESLGSVDFFMYSRLASVLVIAFWASSFACILYRISRSISLSLVYAFAMLASPISVLFAGASYFVSAAPGLIFVVFSVLVTWTVADDGALRRVRHAAPLALAAVLTTLSYLSYQVFPVFMFVAILMVALHAPLSEAARVRRFAVNGVAVFVAGTLLYLAVQKLIILPVVEAIMVKHSLVSGEERSMSFTANPLAMVRNLVTFYETGFQFATSLWFPYGSKAIAWWAAAVTILLAAAAAASALWACPRAAMRRLLERGVVVVVAVLGCHTLQLTRPDAAEYYRTAAPVGLLWMAVLLWAVLTLMRHLPVRRVRLTVKAAAVTAMVGVCLFVQAFAVNNMLLVSARELAFLEGATQPLLRGGTNHVVVEPPGATGVLFHGDEFGVLTTGFRYEYGLHGAMARIMAKYNDIAPEAFVFGDYRPEGIDIRNERSAAAGGLDPALRVPLAPLRYKPLKARVFASSTHREFGPQNLLEPASATTLTAWHAAVPPRWPQTVEFVFPKAERLAGVGIMGQPGDLRRGPRAVEVQGSDDGLRWTTLARLADACTTKDFDEATIQFPPTSLRRMKLVLHSNCGDPELLTVYRVRFQ